jgi:hypothetical protein
MLIAQNESKKKQPQENWKNIQYMQAWSLQNILITTYIFIHLNTYTYMVMLKMYLLLQ